MGEVWKFIGVGIASALLISCGFMKRGSSSEEKDSVGREQVSIGLQVQSRPGITFQLAPGGFYLDRLEGAVTAQSVTITHCASGYNPATISAAEVKLYRYDEGCRAELDGFTYGGRDYTPSGAKAWDEGTSATYSADADHEVMVSVVNGLNDPLDAADSVVYVFQEILKSTATITDYEFAHSLTIEGIEAPNFSVETMTLSDINASGYPTFDVTFDCEGALTATTCKTPGDVAQAMAGMQVLLLEDTYGGTLTWDEAHAAFALPANAAAIKTVDANAITAGGAFGFKVSPQMATQLYGHQDMVLLVRFAETVADPAMTLESFRYFTASVATPSN